MESTDTQQRPNTSYGDYILRTGGGLVGRYEEVVGAFFYQSRFAGCSRIVDIGPGRCWFTRQNPQIIVAVDNSPELVEHYSRVGIDIRLGDAYKLGLPDEYVDGVFCCWLFEHLGDPLCGMREIRRVMKAGGYGLIIVPTPRDIDAFYDDYTHVRPFTKTSLKQLAEDAGFRRHRETYYPYVRGAMQVLQYFGPRVTLGYYKFCDRVVRKLGLLGKNNLMLEVWK